jgi:hypothetical protein
MDDLDGLGDKELIHSALRRDVDIVARYGEKHPGTWAGAWFDNDPAVCVVAAFTADLDRHEAALRPQLGHPDRLVLRQWPHSLSDLRRTRAEIERAVDQRAAETGRMILSSIGEGKGVILIALRADQENLASELAERYGSAVELQVGAFSFPDRRRRGPPAPVRPTLEERTFEGLEVSLEVDQKVLEVGDDGHARIVLRNGGLERLGPLVSSQPVVGSLLDASHGAAGGFTGPIAGTGLVLDLAPGQTASIPVIYGTASTRQDLGYAVPTGTYWLKVQMPFRHGRKGGPPTHVVTAPLTQIMVTPRRPRHP